MAEDYHSLFLKTVGIAPERFHSVDSSVKLVRYFIEKTREFEYGFTTTEPRKELFE